MKMCHYVLGLEGSGKQHLLHPVAQAVPAYGEKRIYENCHFTWHQFAPNTQYQKISKYGFCLRYIYIYCMYIYICIIGCKRSVHSMDCGQTTTVLFPSVYPLAIQHPGVVESHHVSYVNHWTKWHCCQIARGFLHLRCGLCDDLGMQLPSLLLFLFQGKRSLKMNVPISNWAICRDINKYTHVLCIWTCSNMDMYLCNICTYTYKGQDAVGVHFSLFLPNSNSLTVSNTLTIC